MSEFMVVVILAAAVLAVWAMYYYMRRAQTQPTGPDPQAYIDGLKALNRGQDEVAFVKLKETVGADSNNVDAYLQLGDIFRRRKNPQMALQIHRDLTYRHNLTPSEKQEILVSLYYDFIELKDDTSAFKAIEEVLELFSNDRFALKELLKIHEKAGEWKEAANILRRLDKLDGQESKKLLAFYKVFEGEELIRQGDPHRARLFFKDAINFDKFCMAAYIAIGDSYFTEKRLEDAIGYWTRVISLKPADGQLVFERLKKGFFEVGRYGDYADTLSNLLQSVPDHLTARLELAYFLEKKGERDAAREHYTTALDTHPESMLAKLGLFRLNRESGRREAADLVFKQIIKMAVKKEAGTFRCKSCGLVSESKVWFCPRCKAIDTFETAPS
jgi:lipopolysaccharide assembly protein B